MIEDLQKLIGAYARKISHLTLAPTVRDGDVVWQAGAKFDEIPNGYNIAYDADPLNALLKSIASAHYVKTHSADEDEDLDFL